MSFDQDPNEQANVSAADFAMMCDEMKRLKEERDDADRRAGAAERMLERAQDNELANIKWMRKAKEQWGVSENTSFDVVWDQCLKLKAELEIERMRLAACGVAALSNTPESVARRIGRDSPYWSASYGDVCAAVDREMALRDYDVRKIMIDVQPGHDGMGHEVYAKSIADVEKLLSDLSLKLDDAQNNAPKLVGYATKTSYGTLANWHAGKTPKPGEKLYILPGA